MTEIVRGDFPAGDPHPTLSFIRKFPFLQGGAWVAGGAMRHIFGCPHPPSDIDVFFRGGRRLVRPETSPALSTAMDFFRHTHHSVTARGYTYHWKGKLIQLITNRGYADEEQLINDIDYTVCRGATDGYRWVADARMQADIKARRLVAVMPSGVENQCGRLMKYLGYGYTPAPGTITLSLNLSDTAKLRRALDAKLRWTSGDESS